MSTTGRRPCETYEAQMKAWMAARESLTRKKIYQLQENIREHRLNPDLYASMAMLHRESGNGEAAEATLRQGIEACPNATDLYWGLATLLRELGRINEAIALASLAIPRLPEGLQFRFVERLTVPVIYDNKEEITAWRHHFIRGLKECETEILTAPREALSAFLKGLEHFTNFYLSYQGYNDVNLQRRYGHLVHHVMKAQYPEWATPLSMPDLDGSGKIRVGYVSTFLYNHTVARLFVGWLEECDRKRFQINVYYSGRREDIVTKQLPEVGDVFHHIPGEFEMLCRQIRKDQLHVLIFLDIGMAPETTMLAALRLAPVQCATWGHSVTSGLPTMDYFLSSDLMEPPGAQRHYSERLVLLPGIGICIDKPRVPRAILTKPRSAWGLPEDAVVYLCCQSNFKYLPRHDHIFPKIAQQVAKAQFVFLVHESQLVSRFQERLRRAFSASRLNSDDYCVFLPAQHQFDYWNLNLVSDVFLDNLGWSGSMTCLDALSCGLPVVTLPGEFMRGRHSYAILTQLGITSTIASSEKDYVEIAVRLGKDSARRKAIRKQIAENELKLFPDKRGVRALEEFLENVVTRLQNGHAKLNETENYVDGNQS